MVNQVILADEPLDRTFGALATPLRRRMLAQLREAPATPTDLWRGSGVSKPAISKNLALLEQAGLLVRDRDGRRQWVRLRAQPLRPAAEWLFDYHAFWESRLDALAEYLENNPE